LAKKLESPLEIWAGGEYFVVSKTIGVGRPTGRRTGSLFRCRSNLTAMTTALPHSPVQPFRIRTFSMNNMINFYPPASPDTPAPHQPVTHEAIAGRAREIWMAQGCPANCDEAIWLEAEAELLAIQNKRYRHPHLQISGQNGS
jgi:hypothetical protein